MRGDSVAPDPRRRLRRSEREGGGVFLLSVHGETKITRLSNLNAALSGPSALTLAAGIRLKAASRCARCFFILHIDVREKRHRFSRMMCLRQVL